MGQKPIYLDKIGKRKHSSVPSVTKDQTPTTITATPVTKDQTPSTISAVPSVTKDLTTPTISAPPDTKDQNPAVPEKTTESNSKHIKITEKDLERLIKKDAPGFTLPGTGTLKACKELTQWQDIDPDTQTGDCPICLCGLDEDIVQLAKCNGHCFHKACIVHCYNASGYLKCPICSYVYGVRKGKQPQGTMVVDHLSHQECPLAGYPDIDTIRIIYNFPDGTQGPEHPNPGQSYTGTSRTAYLPNNTEGLEVLRLLRISFFERKLTFTIGTSVTTGTPNCVIWNGVHHKTATSGGATNFGYPDETYFDRVKEELKSLGVV